MCRMEKTGRIYQDRGAGWGREGKGRREESTKDEEENEGKKDHVKNSVEKGTIVT